MNNFRVDEPCSRGVVSRATPNLAALTILMIMSSCQQRGIDDRTRQAQFVNYCRTFHFIAPQWRGQAAKAAKGIRSGELKDYTYDIQFRDLHPYISPQELRALDGKIISKKYTVVIKFKPSFELTMPHLILSNGQLNLAAPPARQISCGSAENKGLTDYFER